MEAQLSLSTVKSHAGPEWSRSALCAQLQEDSLKTIPRVQERDKAIQGWINKTNKDESNSYFIYVQVKT